MDEHGKAHGIESMLWLPALGDVILSPSADGRRIPALCEETAETLRCAQGDSMGTFADIKKPVS